MNLVSLINIIIRFLCKYTYTLTSLPFLLYQHSHLIFKITGVNRLTIFSQQLYFYWHLFQQFFFRFKFDRREFCKKIFTKDAHTECIDIDDSEAIAYALLRMGKNGGKAQSVKDATRRKDDNRHRCAVDICHFSLGGKGEGEPFPPAIRERFPRGNAKSVREIGNASIADRSPR